MIDFPPFIDNLRIEKIVNKGFGLAYYDKFTVFIEYALPGDCIKAEILYKKKNALFGKISHYYEHASLKNTNLCPHNGLCGGCDWINLDYNAQLILKNQIIEDIYFPLKKLITPEPIIPSPTPLHYRNKSFLPLCLFNNEPAYGMYARSSHSVIPHQLCYIQPLIFNQIADQILDYIKKSNAEIYNEIDDSGNLRHIGIRQSDATHEILIVLVTKKRKLPFTQLLVKNLVSLFPQIVGIIQNIQPEKTNVIIGEDDKILFGRDYLMENLNEIRFNVHYKAFFQVNSSQTINIYDKIKELSGNNKHVLDAYSGTGSIGLYLAHNHKQITFIESSTEAHLNAIENAKINNISNTSFFNGEVENILPDLINNQKIDLIVFDPPRKGIESSVLSLISQLNIPQIIYMSCNPSTQVRDLRILTELGYKIKKLLTYDMFPHTWHVESLCLLEKNTH